MESGEKELRKIFEDVTTGNVKTVIDYSKNTRSMIRNLESTVVQLQSRLIDQDANISALRTQLAGVQAKVYAGGTS